MLTRLLALVHSKIALATLGVLLVAGSGAAVAAATHSQSPTVQASSTTSHTPDASDGKGDHAHSVALEGKLTAYSASSHTIAVQAKDSGKATTVNVDANTRVDGEHANSLKDLTGAIGHDVQVQATKQSNGSLLAWKITVQGIDAKHGSDDGEDGTGDDGQQHAVAGTITAVSASSFTVKLANNSSVTVTASASTQFDGTVHSFRDLKMGMHVSVQGLMQSNGDFAATRIAVMGTD